MSRLGRWLQGFMSWLLPLVAQLRQPQDSSIRRLATAPMTKRITRWVLVGGTFLVLGWMATQIRQWYGLENDYYGILAWLAAIGTLITPAGLLIFLVIGPTVVIRECLNRRRLRRADELQLMEEYKQKRALTDRLRAANGLPVDPPPASQTRWQRRREQISDFLAGVRLVGIWTWLRYALRPTPVPEGWDEESRKVLKSDRDFFSYYTDRHGRMRRRTTPLAVARRAAERQKLLDEVAQSVS